MSCSKRRGRHKTMSPEFEHNEEKQLVRTQGPRSNDQRFADAEFAYLLVRIETRYSHPADRLFHLLAT
jgi:hypothetical protein